MLNIAHRGASGTFPENTLSAFRAAIDAGADMCELDVQLSRDGGVVVIHDETVERTTDGKGEVAELTLEELKRLDAGAKFKGGALTGERISTLDEVFAVTSGRCGLNIELKAGGLEHQVAQIMQARNAFSDSIVSSFDWEYLKKIQQLHFNIRVGLLAEEKPVDLMMNAVAMRAHAINPRWDMVTADLCKAAHERDLRVYTWTVDADARMRALVECGVDGIMTNYPERLRTVVGG
ncbi:MAG TPA: glycerophosphodiester phosphodiesterase family protein [Candidatus Binatus sp.]|uniref:glycerophosphodiester phosphodiesterase n=1 Tax=Candidatus Binatus sp. TaxID=2811406 RepID=UPI002B480671|nr:glycerophosphodiester phosphodiesterase family protein [Candidatus Binatus sp.]HKN13428.1 glycerophosphodiester phosphodiesterase family protein [Candidatus Binatus sp.]